MIGQLPLDDFREMIGWNPWKFWGFSHPTILPISEKCSDVIWEQPYNAFDIAGRTDFRRKINLAHRRIAEYLNYDVGVRYRDDEMDFPRFVDPVWRPSRSVGSDGRWLSLQVPWKQVRGIGKERHSLIGTPAVTLVDPDGGSLPDYFQIQQATSITDPSQLVVTFRAADRPFNLQSGDDLFEDETNRYIVAPLTISIAGGVATIRGPAWLIGLPSLYQSYSTRNQSLDPTDAGSFATALDVWRVWYDETGTSADDASCILSWETVPEPMWDFCCGNSSLDSSTDPSATGRAVARAHVRDSLRGEISFGQACYNSTSETWGSVLWSYCRPPDRVRVRYRAGVDLNLAWKMAITRLTLAELPRRICACDVANKSFHEWQFDLARSGGEGGEAYAAVSAEDLANPFGTRRGHVYAWKTVCKAAIGVGIRI